MWGLALLSLVTFAQALAIWSTPAGWTLGAIVSVACVAAAILGFSSGGVEAH